MVLKELIFNSSTLGGHLELRAVSTFVVADLERTDFSTVSILGGCGGLDKN